ncbi:MAG: hypothetical protein AB1Z38_13320 [Desulfotignum sp.]
MGKDTMLTSDGTENTLVPATQRSFDKETPYTDTGIYIDEQDIANALCLMDLMIIKTRL